MNTDQFIKETEANFLKATAKLQEEFRGVRSNRASVELVDSVMVNCYNQTMPVRELASISIASSRELQISVWDKDALPAVLGALQNAHLGLSLQNDGNVIRAFLPSLSSERRDELSKLAKRISEEARIQIRAKRDEAMKTIRVAEDAKEIREDDLFKLKDQVQKLVDKVNRDIDTLVERKIKELSE